MKMIILQILLIFILSFPVFGQDETNKTPNVLDPEIEAEIFEELKWLKAETETETVWSASKYQQKASEAPSYVSIITHRDIHQYGYRNLAEIISSVSGIYTIYDRTYHYIGVRGFNRLGDLNTRVLLLVDGHRINDTIFQQALIGTDFPIDVDMIERVEITRGPGSCLYGTNAFFAVINVITRKGKDLNGFEISAEAGSYESFKGRLSYGKLFSNDLEITASGTLYSSRGEDNLYYAEFDDPATNNGIVNTKDGDRFSQALLSLAYKNFSLYSGYSWREKEVPTAAFDTAFNEDYFTLDERAYIEGSYTSSLNSYTDLFLKLYYDRYVYEGKYPYDWETEEGIPYILNNRDRDISEWFGGELRTTLNLLKNMRLTLGGEYLYNLHQSFFNYDENPYEVWLDEDDNETSWAFFIHSEIRITETLILNGGIRYDWYETFGDTFNPRLAVIWQAGEKSSLKAIYGTAFRAPDVYENYVTEDMSSQELNPEEIDTYEIIWEQVLAENFKLLVSGFYYTIDGLISQAAYEDDWTYANMDNVEAKGMEIEMHGKLKNGISGQVNYTWQDVQSEDNDDELSNSPKHLVKARVSFPLLQERLNLSIEGNYMSDRKTAQGETADQYIVFNTGLIWKDIPDGLTLSTHLYNLFDERYADPVGEENYQDTIEQLGTTFRFKLTYQF
ncbi:TonB-dependent receptor [Desulfonema limicola]|uniref:TonB-dependent receptor n=1 Tax=Desulfonema limicola TaxID=45656 RepID=A0A975B968_9BACT|nr:TonB-dependent receptor [Desulfonema limicola]QTA81142.1 TonB-dependent receptor [Desulfonema limicola]